MKFITLMLSAMILIGCSMTENKNNEPVSALVYPLHPMPLKEKHMSFYKVYMFSYIDTDGNQYVTEWDDADTSEYNLEQFSKAISECSTIIKDHFPQPLRTVSELEKELAYKPIALCFIQSGYQLKNSEAFPHKRLL